MVEIDATRLIDTNRGRSNNYKTYFVVHNKKDHVQIDPKISNIDKAIKQGKLYVPSQACFSTFFIKCSDVYDKTEEYPDAVTVYWDLDTRFVKLEYDEILTWLELAKDHMMLPQDFDAKAAIVQKPSGIAITTTLDLSGKYQSVMYVYLDTLRHIRENPKYIQAVLYLHNELDVDYYVAYTLAAYFAVHNAGHHCCNISFSTLYGAKHGVIPSKKLGKTESFDIGLARKLYQYLLAAKTAAISWQPEKFDSFVGALPKIVNGRPVKDHGNGATRWKCADKIYEYSKDSLEVSLGELDSSKVTKFIYGDD